MNTVVMPNQDNNVVKQFTSLRNNCSKYYYVLHEQNNKSKFSVSSFNIFETYIWIVFFINKKIMSLTMYEEQRELGCTVTGE